MQISKMVFTQIHIITYAIQLVSCH
ncbi:protein of unknown function [Trichlorobacter ammonificans]|uniref:Uncharacterized protein n=1 Tax=Trichlorobacter ammonificans TaxID=2916410 RepID=A0ABM9D944_9BACT|nr:protein of unknown function [Trichlorobacter ammonificans]